MRRVHLTLKYTTGAVLLHWAIALAILFNLVTGFTMEGYAQPWRGIVVPLHVSFGMLILVLSVLRLAWRLAHRPPPFDSEMPAWERHTAHLVHYVLYCLMFAMPLVGWSILSANKMSLTGHITLFGVITLPPIGPVATLEQPLKQQMHERFVDLHGTGGWILVALLAGHVAGALKHQFIDKQPELQRMWFAARSPLNTSQSR